MKLVIATLLAVGCLSSQDVKVIHLPGTVTEVVKTRWEQLKAAQEAWDRVRTTVGTKYNNSNESYKFSDDFTVIVPNSYGSGSGSGSGIITLTPSVWPNPCTTVPISNPYGIYFTN
jgi:hypothetical protein